MLKKNQTQQQIEAEAERLCHALGPFAEECTAWLDMEIPNIIKYLAHMSPANVCAQLHACSAVDRHFTRLAAAATAERSDLPCPACEMVVSYVDELIKNNEGAEVAWLEAKASALCKKLPAYGAECQYLVAKELEQVIDWLANDVPAQQICARLGLCTAAATTPAVKL
eukprot:CAMPEP_0198336796 /NCGR_PEP_ID=MMETSP1450-20131203/22352_1 /TAXON_ID=753684 ORGANISM="Madagascaria erythrocladiodes, Strain CCMP3234" /NCGR_SAMPLE_ID=MMETSP1450 /ASSEMBLY_ACC=CAM_ASM_001115 /LENGTH=167 /DNA_ID=CAMNT_0044041559 /DNA_START=1 /DNA_END=501 /DNA_ORIENTATION=+